MKLLSTVAVCLLAVCSGKAAEPPERFSKDIADLVKNFTPGGALPDGSLSPSPSAALEQFEVLPGLKLDVPLHEPEVAQPLNMSFDERGRLWVVQYLQYPFPAGLKVVKYDKYLRAVFDKVPQAPPNHVLGRDKITIHEDTDGDGKFDEHKTFVEGLNMARSVITGRGGAWVLMPPFLLFYPDRNRDDVPDGDPEVHLEGFGLEDTHSGANSLRWGPDGWIYGAHGSTCTADVKGVGFLGQAIWRYHPRSREFEVFAEGGGNTYCVEFDREGRLFSGSNYGKTRGLHYPQGSAFIKSWGKHGPLMNPYSYGFFQHMKHKGYNPRFSQTMIIYEGAAIPELEGSIVAGMALTSRMQASRLSRDSSSFQTEDTDVVALSSNRWFRPVDTKAGPDGSIYIADWCDSRLSHLDPRDTWSKETGRIYRLRKTSTTMPRFDYGALSGEELLAKLEHPNKWHRQTALRVLHDRADRSLLPELRARFEKAEGQGALELFWAINAAGGFADRFAMKTLRHPHPMIRYWSVRLLGDSKNVSQAIASALLKRAKLESESEVRVQLASTARRLPAADAFPVIGEMLKRDTDAKDIHIPLLLWWAVEANLDSHSHSERFIDRMADPEFWERPLVKDFIIERLARRLTAKPREGPLPLVKLLAAAPNDALTSRVLSGMEAGLAGLSDAEMSDELQSALDSILKQRGPTAQLLNIYIRMNQAPVAAVLAQLTEAKTSRADKSKLIAAIAEKRLKEAVPVLSELLRTEQNPQRTLELIGALQRFTTTRIASLLIDRLSDWNATLRTAAVSALSGRLEWAQLLLDAVDLGTVKPAWVTINNLLAIREFGCDHCNDLITRHWGKLRRSSAEKENEIKRVRQVLKKTGGNQQRGEELFKLMCSTCHRLGRVGRQIGPNLTGYERDNLDFIIPAIADPSLAIREEYTTFNVATSDGQTLTGFLIGNDALSVTVMDLSGSKHVIPRSEILNLGASATSLMPEGLLSALDDVQLRDLFAYFINAARN
jgi:putative heme-binding domain-containing protein